MARIAPEKNSATICLIVRDEAPYILEWIAHYQSLGVQDFIIYDNKSQDKTSQLLAALAKSGVIQHFYIDKKQASQPAAYIKSVKHCKTEWIGYLDMDEFVKLESHATIPALLSEFGSDVASVSLVWKSFGSSNHHIFSREPVTTRFTQRGADLDFGNMWSKYFARVETLIRPDIHACKSKPGLRHVLANGTDREFFVHQQILPNHQVACLHHYPIKSHEEGLFKTKIRGQTVLGRLDKYNEMYMLSHDVNDVEDMSLALRWGEVSRYLDGLKELSQKYGWHQLFNDCAPTTPHLIAKQRKWPLRSATLVQQEPEAKSANLDYLVISNDSSSIPAVSAIGVQLGLEVSVLAPSFLDAELQLAVSEGKWAAAAARASKLVNDGVQMLTLAMDANTASKLAGQDIFKKLGLRPKGVIGILRDPLANSIKIAEVNQTRISANPTNDLEQSMASYLEVVRQMTNLKSPKLWISAEGLLQNTGALVTDLASFVGVNLNQMEFQALKFATGDDIGLRLAWNSSIDGAVETLLHGKVNGWVRWSDPKKSAVKIQLLINHVLVANITADLLRKDLAKTGKANCGFEIELPADIKPGDVVSVQVQGHKYQLNNSPAIYVG